jgi:hypothetical protein
MTGFLPLAEVDCSRIEQDSWRGATVKDDEFAALRLTIQQRGTARMVVLPLVFVGWAGTAVAAAAVITVPISTLVPLLVLVAGFEAVFALHVNVERIGRYLQVFHADDGGWERVAMLFGQRFPGVGPDPMFGRLFVLATSVNFLPAALGFESIPELVLLAIPHFVFINRIRMARAFAATQRSQDLERFVTLERELHAPRAPDVPVDDPKRVGAMDAPR